MPGITRKICTTDDQRYTALSKAKQMKDNVAPADMAITTATGMRLDAIIALYIAARTAISTADGVKTNGTRDTLAAFIKTGKFVRSFVEVFNSGVEREKYPAQDRSFYQLDISSKAMPSVRTETKLNLWAGNLISGDPARVTAGGAAMANPSIAEVTTEFGAYTALVIAQASYISRLDSAQEALADLNPEADAVIKKVWDEVETFYNEEEPSSKRQNARQWGVVYVNTAPIIFTVHVTNAAGGAALADVLCEIDGGTSKFHTNAGGDAAITTHVEPPLILKLTLDGFTELIHELSPEELVIAEAEGTLNFQLASAVTGSANFTTINNSTLDVEPGVTISLQLTGSPNPPFVQVTDGVGATIFADKPTGNYTATSTKPGFVTDTRAVTILPGGTTTWEVDIDPEP